MMHNICIGSLAAIALAMPLAAQAAARTTPVEAAPTPLALAALRRVSTIDERFQAYTSKWSR